MRVSGFRVVIKGYIGVMVGLYWVCIEAILGLVLRRVGFKWGLYWDNGKYNGNYYGGFKFLGVTPPQTNMETHIVPF